ncbi:MAG: ADP-glyceromanno-heptose 6-epimerase [Leptospirillia bacterium]
MGPQAPVRRKSGFNDERIFMRYLVTGGAGFIGSNLVRRLEADGHDVTVIDDLSSGHFKNLVGFRGDFYAEELSRMDLVSVFSGRPAFDAIFHQASITDTTVMDQRFMMERNVEGFRRVIDYALRQTLPVVYASSAGVYGANPSPQVETQTPAPMNIYGFSKAVLDNIALQASKGYSRTIVGLRYFNVFGPGEDFKGAAASMIYQLYRQMKAGKAPRIFKWGEQGRDFVYVGDVVEANIRALSSRRSGSFNVGSGSFTTFNTLVETLRESLKLDVKTEYFDNPYDFYQEHTHADIQAAKEAFGYSPQTPVVEGIREYVRILESRGR